MLVCRDSLGAFEESVFSLWTCALCYVYIFPKNNLKFNYNKTHPRLFSEDLEYQIPDIKDLDAVSRICENLDNADCTFWRKCCLAADVCCKRQQQKQLSSRNITGLSVCPSTWDGFSCFDATTSGKTIIRQCPSYIRHASSSGQLVKRCTTNGSWALHPSTGNEWTDYGDCVNMKGIKGVVYAGVVANSISLCLLVPAVGIFLGFRQLRNQYRVMLHVCLLMSFVLTCLLQFTWTLAVYQDRLLNPFRLAFMATHEDFCKILNMMLRYARGTNFMWMFCEGIFLHRLLIQAFKSPHSIRYYFLAGWGIPLLPVSLYAILRWKYANDNCWIQNAGGYEWILYTPNLICIAGNILFLLSILKILLTQLQQHPNEPSNYRRALRATGVLVPLFGLQLVLVMYRPSEVRLRNMYEVVARLVIDSQGGFVALIFCYLNAEVHSCVKTCLGKLRVKKNRNNVPMYFTSYSVITQKGNDVTEATKPAGGNFVK